MRELSVTIQVFFKSCETDREASGHLYGSDRFNEGWPGIGSVNSYKRSKFTSMFCCKAASVSMVCVQSCVCK
jgi:hypothetical protein